VYNISRHVLLIFVIFCGRVCKMLTGGFDDFFFLIGCIIGEHFLQSRYVAGAFLVKILISMLVVALFAAISARAETIEGRWKLISAEDLRDDGSVGQYPWGRHAVGWIVIERGWCLLQIMSTDVPSLSSTDRPVGDQMKDALIKNYIGYEGPCTIDEKAGTLTMNIDAAWRPDYPGSQQKRFFHFENSKLIFGMAPNAIHTPNGNFTRKLTLERP
jgi:hypothetical protein